MCFLSMQITSGPRMSERKKKVGLCLLLAFVSIAGSAESRVISLEEVLGHYPEEITLIAQCGRWTTEGQAGFYKIIAAEFLFGGSRLWVQWMADRDNDGRTHAVHTLSFEEINEEHVELLFAEVRCEESRSGIVLYFSAEDGHDAASIKAKISVSETIGEYQFLAKRKCP